MPLRLEDLPDAIRATIAEAETLKRNGRQPGAPADKIHGAAVDALYALRNLTKPDKRRALTKAIKLLDA